MVRVEINLMKTILYIVLLSVITCFSSTAKDSFDDSIRMSVPDVLVIKMLLFGEMISTETPEIDRFYWPDASAKLTPNEIKLAKSLTDENNYNNKNVFYKIENVVKVQSLDSITDDWEATYREFDKKLKTATDSLVRAKWFKSSSGDWHIASIGRSKNGQ